MTAGFGARVGAIEIGLIVVLASLAILGIGGLVLAWDGAWFVVRAAETGTPTFLHGRAAGWLIQAPIILASQLTGEPAVLTVVAGLAFAAVPAAAVLASWRITRPDRDDLLALAILGIGLASLAGLAILISEAMMAVALGWPLILAAGLGRLARHRALMIALALLLAMLHPFAVPILVLVGGAVVVRTVAHRSERPVARMALLLIGILVVSLAVRYVLFGTSYEADTFDLERLAAHWRGAIEGRPSAAIAIAWALGLLVTFRPKRDLLGIALVLAGTAGATVAMIVWAADTDRWQHALAFRTYVLAASVPLMGLAVLAGRRSSPDDGPGISAVVVPAVGFAMIVVLTVQTLAWRDAVETFGAELATRPDGCVDGASLPIPGTALDHWGVTSLGLAIEGPAPRHLVVLGIPCTEIDATGGVPTKILDGRVVERVPPDGWLDLRALAAP